MKKEMTFTQQVKEEICTMNAFNRKEMLAILSGFIKVNGHITFSQKQACLEITTENSKIAKCLFHGFKQCFDCNPRFGYSKKIRLNKCVIYHVFVKEHAKEILETLEVADGFLPTFPKLLVLDEGLRFFITGAFLASGSISSPTNGNYHLQLIMNTEEEARYFLKLFNRFKNERTMDFKSIQRRKKYVLYLKRADQIAVFLAMMGASESMLSFENIRIQKDFINSENRYQICVNANYQKTLKKATQQVDDIECIYAKQGRWAMNEKQALLADLRLANPDASLSNLSELLYEQHNIQLSKSGVNLLLNEIHAIAEGLRKE